MPKGYKGLFASSTLKEAGVLVEEIAYRIKYVEGLGKYIGNGGAVDRNLDEVRTRLDRLKVTQRSLSKFIKDIDSLISEEMAKNKEDNLACTSDDPNNHQGDTCPIHEA